MARTIQQRIDDIDAALQVLEQADAMHSHREGPFEFQAQRIEALYAERRKLEAQLYTGARAVRAINAS